MKPAHFVTNWQSPIGMLEIIVSDQSLLSIKKSNKKITTSVESHRNGAKTGEHIENDKLTKKVIQELKSYMEGKQMEFDLLIEMEGTPFQNAVWKALLKIPVGQTKTYGQIAAMIKRPKAARAVGNALNSNPICIVVPCHRVTSANGLGGYAYGPTMKRALLKIEGVSL